FRACDSLYAEAEHLEDLAVDARRVSPPGEVVIRVARQRLEASDALLRLQERRNDDHRLLSQPRYRGHGRNLVAQVFEHSPDDYNVELSERGRQLINVSVEDLRARLQEPVAEPVRVLPLLHLRAVEFGPPLAVLVVELVLERQERLLPHVAHVERDDARRPAPLCL